MQDCNSVLNILLSKYRTCAQPLNFSRYACIVALSCVWVNLVCGFIANFNNNSHRYTEPRSAHPPRRPASLHQYTATCCCNGGPGQKAGTSDSDPYFSLGWEYNPRNVCLCIFPEWKLNWTDFVWCWRRRYAALVFAESSLQQLYFHQEYYHSHKARRAHQRI